MPAKPGLSPDEPSGHIRRAWTRSTQKPHATLFIVCGAALLTLLNALKPLTIDDPLYHALASQIARDPFDPYGFTVHWYQSPQPAFDVLIAPALPYWLAVPVRLFAGSPLACKLWLFPISLLLVGATYSLFGRWARGLERPLVVMTVFSAAMLPSFNLMLDIPVLAASLGALALFARAVDSDRTSLAITAGVLAGLATETKYNGLLSPVVLLLYAGMHRRWRLGVLAAAIAFSIFGAWEAWMMHLYGDSHFHHHMAMAEGTPGAKLTLTLGLVSALGGVGAPVVLLGLAALAVSGRRLGFVALVLLMGYVVLASVSPRTDLIRVRSLHWRISVPLAVCCAYGLVFFGSLWATVARLARRHAGGNTAPLDRWRNSRDVQFLILWLALEVVGYYAFTPFPAVRRILGVLVAAIAVFGRLASRSCRSPARQQGIRAIAACSFVFGLLFYAVDFRDADVARLAVDRARERIGPTAPDSTVWYVGHWGFQFYADRANMRSVDPGKSLLRRGDWLLMLDHRIAQQHVTLPMAHVEEIDPPLEIRDWIPVGTVGSFYTDNLPIRTLRESRFRLWIYRVRDDFVAMP
jgi:hypothetical protein